MTGELAEMTTIPRVEFDDMQAELRRLHREAGRKVALTLIQAARGPGPGDETRLFTREQLAEAWAIRPRPAE